MCTRRSFNHLHYVIFHSQTTAPGINHHKSSHRLCKTQKDSKSVHRAAQWRRKQIDYALVRNGYRDCQFKMMHALDIVMLNQSIAFHTIYVIIRIYWTVLLCYKCKSMLMAKCEYNLYTCSLYHKQSECIYDLWELFMLNVCR